MTIITKYFLTHKFCASQHCVNYSLSAHSTLTVRFGQTSLQDRRIILLNVCEFRENWWSEDYNFLMVVNETPLRLKRETVLYFESKPFGLVHAPHHFQYCYLEINTGTWTHYDIISANKRKQETRRRLMSVMQVDISV
jgi:hypothetical protein